jgi:hypothetical protein
MKCLRWLCLLLLASVSTVSFAGDIQVACEPALRVFLDSKFVGTCSSKEDGLFLANVPGGAHVIRVEKDGFVPQSFQVEVLKLPIEVKVKEFSPEPLIRHDHDRETSSAKGKQPVGNLQVISAPQNCVVEIDGKPETKSTPLLLIEGLAAGEHSISFSKPGYDQIAGVVRIQPGAAVTIRGDLKAGKVETIHEGEGSLRLYSTPEHCTVRFLGMTKEKTRATLNLSHIPAGEHRIVVLWKGLELSSNVVITKGHRTIVTVSFMKGEEPVVVSYEPE